MFDETTIQELAREIIAEVSDRVNLPAGMSIREIDGTVEILFETSDKDIRLCFRPQHHAEYIVRSYDEQIAQPSEEDLELLYYLEAERDAGVYYAASEAIELLLVNLPVHLQLEGR